MEKLQSGDLVKLAHNGKEGIGYIYDNGDTENPHLIIGISWKDGGTSNTTIFEAEADGVVFTKVELKKTFEQELFEAVDAEVEKMEDEILDYFEEHDVDTVNQCFSLRDMARSEGISLSNLHVWLVNMEDAEIMQDIANGKYDSFDVNDGQQFTDSYLDLLSDYASRSFPFS